MKKFALNISPKKLTAIAVVLVSVLASIGVYTIVSINKNVSEMAAAANEKIHTFPAYPAVNTLGKDPTIIKRGEYLAKAGDCIACHTNSPKKGTPFAGGLPMHTPFGTIYSPNITPDKETGIGNWTEAQFIKAMRKGISPSGHYYYPAFPYYYFNKVSLDDLKAIKLYLDSIPAVKQQNRNPEMIKPFNRRFLQLGWRVLFFQPNDTGPYQDDPKQSPLWNRGAYLVEGLGHCAMCHSPSYHIISESISLGAPIQKYNLSGAKIQGYLAPNISKANLNSISTDEIIRVFTEGRLIGGGKIEGPMLEAVNDSLKYLTHSDQLAIATYLKTVISQTPPKPKSSGGPGAVVYEGYCAGCHATGSGGAPKFGDASGWDPIFKNKMDKIYSQAIHGNGGMPAKGTCISCTDTEIKQAVDYMVAAVKGGGVGSSVPRAPKAKPLTLQDGKRIYDKNCSACHQTGFKGAPKLGDKKAWQPTIDAGFFETYQNVVSGRKGHPAVGGCATCTDAELKAAIKYMMQQDTTTKNYELW